MAEFGRRIRPLVLAVAVAGVALSATGASALAAPPKKPQPDWCIRYNWSAEMSFKGNKSARCM